MRVLEFGQELINSGDLDPVYIAVYHAQLPEAVLRRWLVAYWGFYDVGVASWAADSEKDYWARLEKAAASKEWPRGRERRHYRGSSSIESVDWLKGRGVDGLFTGLVNCRSIGEAVREVKSWRQFGSWIAFKAADMLEVLGLAKLSLRGVAELVYDSPAKGAIDLWRERHPDIPSPPNVVSWAISRLTSDYREAKLLAPPSFSRLVGPTECETVLCKYHAYRTGHYRLGEDIAATRKSLMRFKQYGTTQRILLAGYQAGLWGLEWWELPQAGVYYALCSASQKLYVGSSLDVNSRWEEHLRLLRSGGHHSLKLQRAYDKYGEDTFSFALIEEVPTDCLYEREAFWIQHYDSYRNGYNMTPATGPESRSLLDSRLAQSEAAIRAGADPELRRIRSDNAKRQHAAGRLGRATWTPGTHEAVVEKNKGTKHPPIPCSICGARSFLLEGGRRYCFAHDPVPGRNEARNASRRSAQKAIPSKNRKPSSETIEKIREALTGREVTEEFRQKMSEIMKRRYSLEALPTLWD